MLYRLILVVLLISPPQGVAEDKPFELQGLHTNLTLRDALARAEALGGRCAPIRARNFIGGLKSRCTFPACNPAEGSEACSPETLEASTFTIAGQPIHALDIEAPSESSRLRNISLFYWGDPEPVMQRMLALYGEPKFDTGSQLDISWTPSRRLMWQRGIQRITYITQPPVVLLAADRPQHDRM